MWSGTRFFEFEADEKPKKQGGRNFNFEPPPGAEIEWSAPKSIVQSCRAHKIRRVLENSAMYSFFFVFYSTFSISIVVNTAFFSRHPATGANSDGGDYLLVGCPYFQSRLFEGCSWSKSTTSYAHENERSWWSSKVLYISNFTPNLAQLNLSRPEDYAVWWLETEGVFTRLSSPIDLKRQLTFHLGKYPRYKDTPSFLDMTFKELSRLLFRKKLPRKILRTLPKLGLTRDNSSRRDIDAFNVAVVLPFHTQEILKIAHMMNCHDRFWLNSTVAQKVHRQYKQCNSWSFRKILATSSFTRSLIHSQGCVYRVRIHTGWCICDWSSKPVLNPIMPFKGKQETIRAR